MHSHLKPLGDRVLVRPLKDRECTEGGILIPETAGERPLQGCVVALGTGTPCKRILDLKPGDHVLLNRRGGLDVPMEEEILKLVAAEDILALVSEPRTAEQE